VRLGSGRHCRRKNQHLASSRSRLCGLKRRCAGRAHLRSPVSVGKRTKALTRMPPTEAVRAQPQVAEQNLSGVLDHAGEWRTELLSDGCVPSAAGIFSKRFAPPLAIERHCLRHELAVISADPKMLRRRPSQQHHCSLCAEQRRRYFEAERLGSFEVDHQLVFCRCLHRGPVSRL